MTTAEREFLNILSETFHPQLKKSDVKLSLADWVAVMNVASSQNLLPIVYNVSSDYPGFQEFDNSNSKYMITAMQQMAAQVQKNSEFLNLYKVFLEVGVSPIVVKGMACRSLYGNLQEFRPSCDEDILVEKNDYEQTARILESNGFESHDVADKEMDVIQEVTFYNKETEVMIEVHLNPFGEATSMKKKMNEWFRDVFDKTIVVDIEGVPVRILSPTDHLLFLFFHCFGDFVGTGISIRQILDILLHIEKYSKQIDWDYINRGLRDVNATYFAADIIAVGNEYLGFNLPIVISNDSVMLDKVCPAELLKDIFVKGGTDNRVELYADAYKMVAPLLEGQKRSNKLVDTFHLIFPSWNQWKGFKPYLVDKPWMLPVEWLKRVGRYLKKRDKVDFSESRKIADRRIELLKKYKVI